MCVLTRLLVPALAFFLAVEPCLAHPDLAQIAQLMWDPHPSCNGRIDQDRQELLLAFQEMETSLDDVQALRERIDVYFTWFPYYAGATPFPLSLALASIGVTDLDIAIAAFARGHDEIARQKVERLCARLPEILAIRVNGPQCGEIEKFARLAGMDPAIYYPMTVAEFLLRKAPTLEATFLTAAFGDGLMSLRAPGDPSRSFLGGRPQQLEGVKAVMQFSNTQPGDKILEVGYLSLGQMLTLKRYFQDVKFLGVDLVAPPEQATGALSRVGVELLTGNLVMDKDTRSQVEGRGPFAAIMAVDSILDSSAPTLNGRISGREYADWLAKQLQDGGALVILNDRERQPSFTRSDAEAAGLTVVRWGDSRLLGNRLRELSRVHGLPPETGRMSLFVLRRGKLPQGRFEIRN